MQRIAIGLGALTVLGIGAAIATGAIPDEDGYTYTCVNKNTGVILAREKTASCPKNFTASRLVTNQTAVPNTTTYTAVDFTAMVSGDVKALSVHCNDGDVATGGGVENSSVGTIVSSSMPTPSFEGETPTGWHVVAKAGDSSQTQQLGVYAVCQHTE